MCVSCGHSVQETGTLLQKTNATEKRWSNWMKTGKVYGMNRNTSDVSSWRLIVLNKIITKQTKFDPSCEFLTITLRPCAYEQRIYVCTWDVIDYF